MPNIFTTEKKSTANPLAEFKVDIPLVNTIGGVKKQIEQASSSPISVTKKSSTPETTNVSAKDELVSIGKGVVGITGGGQIAKGLGIAGSLINTDKKKQEIQQTNDEIEKIINKKIIEAGSDVEKKKQLISLKKNLPSPDFTAEALSEAPTTKQIVADAGQLALFATLGFKPNLPGGYVSPSAVKGWEALAQGIKSEQKAIDLIRLTPAQRFAKESINFGGRVLKDAGIGSAFFGLTEAAMDQNATVESTLDQIKKGGLLGGGITTGAGALGGLIRLSGKYLAPAISEGMGKYVSKLEADAAIKPKMLGDDPVQNMLNFVGDKATFGNKVARAQLTVINKAKEFVPSWIDRNSAFKKVENQILNANKGNFLDETEKVYRDSAMADDWALAKAGEKVTGLNEKLNNYSDIRDDYTAYLLNLDLIDRTKLSQGVTTGGYSLPDYMANLNQMVKTFGPEKTKRVQEVETIIKNYTDDLLATRLNAGLIDGNQVMAMKLAHPSYLPHEAIMSMDDEIARKFGNGNSMNVSKTDLQKALGSIKNIKDPIEALQKHTIFMEQVLENNRIVGNTINAAEKYKLPGFRPVRTAENVLEKSALNADRSAVVAERNATKGKISEILSDKNAVSKEIIEIKNKIFKNSSYNGLYQKVSEKYEKAINEAKNLASEFGAPHQIKKLENIAINADKKLMEIERNIFTKIEEFGKQKATDIESKTQSLADLNTYLNQKNKIMDEASEQISNLNKKLSEVRLEPVKQGEKVVNFFRQGIKEEWVVPADLAIAIKGLNIEPTTGFMKLLSLPAKALKLGATQLNLSFAIPNKFRDMQTAAITTQPIIDDLARRYGKNYDVLKMGVDDIHSSFKTSGTYGSSIFKDGDKAVLNDLEKSGFAKVMEYSNPLKMISEINSLLEQSTRESVFTKALGQGLSVKDAAFASRNATVDFSKMGTAMRDINKVIPFLNARIQGFINLGESFFKNPEAFARAQMYTSIYPTLLLQRNNRRFESNKNISQHWKDKGWVIQYDEQEVTIPDTGEKKLVPKFVFLPKGEGQILTSGPLQYFLDKADGIDYRKTSEMLADVLGNTSPLSFQSFNRNSPFWGSVTSQLGPLATIPAGLATNIEPYTGSKIVPDKLLEGSPGLQFKNSTPESIKTLTDQANKILNLQGKQQISPARIEYILKSFGGLPTDTAELIDLITAPLTGKDIALKSLTGSLTGEWGQVPILNRMFKEDSGFGSSESVKNQKIKEDVVMKTTDINNAESNRTAEIFRTLNSKSPSEKKDYINSLGSEFNDQLATDLMALGKSKRTYEALTKSDSAFVKAGYIEKRLSELNQKEKTDFIRSLINTGLFTDDVATEIMRIESDPKLKELNKNVLIK